MDSIKQHMTDENKQTCHQVIGFYNQVIYRCEHGPSFFQQKDRSFDRKKKSLTSKLYRQYEMKFKLCMKMVKSIVTLPII